MEMALAGISLAFQVFAGCVQGFSLITAACAMHKDARILACMLGLEEQKLFAWAQMSGLLEDRLDQRLNTQAILAALQELSVLLNDRERLRSYGLQEDAEDSSNAIQPATADLDGTISLFGFVDGRMRVDRNSVLRKAGESLKIKKRLRWVVSDRAKMESYIQRIHVIVDTLQSLLDQIQSQKLLDELRMVKLQMIGLASTVTEATVLQHADRITAGHETQESMLAGLRTYRISQDQRPENQPWTPSTLDNQDIPIAFAPLPKNDISSIVELKQHRCRATAIFNGRPVLIDWKRYNYDERQDSDIFNLEKRITDLFQLLSAPKPRDFYTPQCIGYFEDPSHRRFGFLYPQPVIQVDQEITLLSLLQTPIKPSLTARLGLARALAKQVYQLLIVDWLHKGLCSENILFTIPKTSTQTDPHQSPMPALGNPYVFGYEYSRPDSTNEFSERPPQPSRKDIYRHPEVVSLNTGSPYKWHHDVYSLGLVLLEIAKWRPLKRIIRSKVDIDIKPNRVVITQPVAVGIRNHLLSRDDPDSDHLGDVEFRAGTSMMEAIRSCLSEFDMEPSDTDGALRTAGEKAQRQRQFYTSVVQKLDQCRV